MAAAPPPSDARYWNRPTQTAPREVLDRWHLERIRHLVDWAYRYSPMYRRLYDDAGVKPADIRTWNDFHHRLPFTDKPDFLADQDREPSGFGGMALPAEEIQMYFHTTGTTGRFLNEGFTQFEMQVSGRGESHPPALSGPDVTVSRHPAPTVRPLVRAMRCQWAKSCGSR